MYLRLSVILSRSHRTMPIVEVFRAPCLSAKFTFSATKQILILINCTGLYVAVIGVAYAGR
jgi:hypothetical protein